MPDGYQFDADSVRRIEAAVQAVERMAARGLLPGNLNLGPLPERTDVIPFRAAAGQTIPAWGVATFGEHDPEVADFFCWSLVTLQTPSEEDPEPVVISFPDPTNYNGDNRGAMSAAMFSLVNLSGDVTASETGLGTLAAQTPAWALCDPAPYESLAGIAGQRWGLAPGDYKLRYGFPGFTSVGPYRYDPPRILVIRETPALAKAKASADWVSTTPDYHYVEAHPAVKSGGASYHVYDGVDYSPHIDLKIRLPTPNTGREPSVFAGDLLEYRIAPANMSDWVRWIGVGSYCDDPVGTIKIFPSGATLPNGWQDYSTIPAGDFLVAGVGAAGAFGAAGAAYGYSMVRLIQRYK